MKENIRNSMKAILIIATVISFLCNMEILAWITLTIWTWKGLFKMLSAMEKAGAFND